MHGIKIRTGFWLKNMETPIRTHRLRCEDNIETDFRRKIWKCTNYINLAQYTDQCLTITNEVQKNVS